MSFGVTSCRLAQAAENDGFRTFETTKAWYMKRLEHIETFKPSYTSEEIAELTTWFEERMDKLPKTLQLIDCLSTRDLPRTVRSYIRLLQAPRQNVAFSGYVAQLFLIREALKRDYPDF